MGQSIIYQVFDRPAASFTIALLIAIFAKIHSAKLGYGDVGASYDAVVVKGETWRLIISQLSHISPLHLLMNVVSLWNVSGVAEAHADTGTLFYISRTLLLLTLSAIGFIAIYAIGIKGFKRQQDANVTCVGYSCVIFGLMAYGLTLTAGWSATVDVYGLPIPAYVYPWAALVLTSVLIPQASFVGHLAGLLAGYAVGLTSDYVNSLACVVVFLVFLALIASGTVLQQLPLIRQRMYAFWEWARGLRLSLENSAEDDTELIRRERLRSLDPQSEMRDNVV